MSVESREMFDQHLTRPAEEPEEEEVAEHGMEATREYMCQSDTEKNTVVMCNKVENELYRLRAKDQKILCSRGVE
jgi:hypothetical protein